MTGICIIDSADLIEDEVHESYINLKHHLPDAPHVDKIIATRSWRAQRMSSSEAVIVGKMTEVEGV